MKHCDREPRISKDGPDEAKRRSSRILALHVGSFKGGRSGGFKAGYVHGATDEWGHKAVENVVHHYDWHATLLHCFGLDHTQLAFSRAGVKTSLTDGQDARVVKELLT